jgi:GT2 family glycosyltransferase
MLRPAVTSVVLVNYRGVENTLEALESIEALDWPRDRLEVIVVDNASGGDEVARIRGRFPGATVIELDQNVGFAGGCNRGAATATGEYLAFLNNDARPDPGWLREAVPALDQEGVACVASRILDWEGEAVDFIGAALTFYGHGLKPHAGDTVDLADDQPTDVLFASGAAMVVDAEIFRDAGQFDEKFFMFFEDVDFGWRLWLQGYRVRYVPSSLVFHRHHASMSHYGSWHENYLLERNALFTIYKNYDDEHLRRTLPAALLLAVRRRFITGGQDSDALDLAVAPGEGDDEFLEVSKEGLSGAYAVDAFARAMPRLRTARRQVQARRRRADFEITRLFKMPLFPNIGDPRFVADFDAIVDASGVRELFTPRRRVLIATGDVLEPKMAGPAIRAWHMATNLAEEHDVTLVTTLRCNLSSSKFDVQLVDDAGLRELVARSEIVIFQGNLMAQHPVLEKTQNVVVADIYDPFHLEVLEQARGLSALDRRFATRSSKDVLNQQLMRGDFFLCASEKQRDFWLGQLAAVGRVNPATYDEHENLDSLIAVVPFGVGDEPPRHTRPVLKGVVPGIGPDDKVILWGGGVYNWFDPLTLLRAVDKLRRRVPNVRLYFLGVKHPNPHVGEMRMAVESRQLAQDLGLTDSHVFFNEDWVPYEERQDYLLESDIGVSTHFDHIETAFSFRTRILDYFWAGLPVVATAGDSLAALIESATAGVTVPAGDVDALEAALHQLLDDEEFRRNCARASQELAKELAWSKVLRPILEFCRAPRRAPDLVDPLLAPTVGDPVNVRRLRRRLQRDLGILSQHLRDRDYRTLVGRVKRRLSRLTKRV